MPAVLRRGVPAASGYLDRGQQGAGLETRSVIEEIMTERMRLRPITLDDVDALVALDRDPEVMRYLSGGRPTPRDEVV